MNNKSAQPQFNIELGGSLKTHQQAWNKSAQELIPEDLAEIIKLEIISINSNFQP